MFMVVSESNEIVSCVSSKTIRYTRMVIVKSCVGWICFVYKKKSITFYYTVDTVDRIQYRDTLYTLYRRFCAKQLYEWINSNCDDMCAMCIDSFKLYLTNYSPQFRFRPTYSHNTMNVLDWMNFLILHYYYYFFFGILVHSFCSFHSSTHSTHPYPILDSFTSNGFNLPSLYSQLFRKLFSFNSCSLLLFLFFFSIYSVRSSVLISIENADMDVWEV